ncbi:MAG: hypothetical protein IPP13_09090 [Kouleothrix sp.]|jgi:hypothetical protein|nr:hypothetical protein [Kouleothrix sp.]
MTETAIKSNEREAARLYERGVGAARGGQRRMAAGLLARAVQLNPRHEQAWLWLSGVLDTPDDIAFCLRAVLAVNPHNERARQGLAWLDQRGMTTPQSASTPVAPPAEPRAAAAGPGRREQPEHEASWWVGWRHNRRDSNRARTLLWVIPILLLLLTLGLNAVLRSAIDRNIAQAIAAAQPRPAATALPALPPIIQAELPSTRDAAVLAYLSALDLPRTRLRAAITGYRATTGQPGGSAIVHAAAARTLREQIDALYREIDAIEPPPGLAPAHNRYLAGLEIERQALDDMLEFYSSLAIQSANRATLRMADSAHQIELARQLLDTRRAVVPATSIPAQTLR